MIPLLYLLLLARFASGGGESRPAADPIKSADDNSTFSGNGTSNATVIKCDDEGFFSTYAICAPGKCCSNIPIGISGTIALLTIAISILSFVVLRSSCAPSPASNEPKPEKNSETEKEESLTSQQLAVAAAAPATRPLYPAV